jgi:hypothetical protein
MMQSRRHFFSRLALGSISLFVASSMMLAQEQIKHGRKYKPPPETSKITVQVTKKFNGKPIMNAAVIFNPFDKDGNDIGNLEVKTDPEGRATIDIIPTGSTVRVQVIASGYATFAQDYEIDQTSHDIAVAMVRPQEQVSSYTDNSGKNSTRKAGVQEPVRPKATDKTTTPPAPKSDSPAEAQNPTPAPQQ